ncbi:putative transporter SVOPL isoform X2 [Mercenaria mercenaria]|uniref:putative transporter SVOPL isoform X2 n=1 Tax=Mercenaria mercenaria TaxID=6596 RepID=UPI001E1E1E5A|nr:putative transporter SVOPL isoform X2 [Mercenaria mercenaria]
MAKQRVKYSKLESVGSGNVDDDLETVSLMHGVSSDEDDVELYKLANGVRPPTFTAEEGVEAIGFGLFQVRLYIICGLFTAADSLEMMLLAVLSPVLRCEWQLEQFHVAFITTVVFIGMCIMAPVWGFMGDKYGRQKTLYMVALWIGYFGLLTSFSPSYTWVLILRGLVGGGMAGSPQSFTLLTEYIPSKYRAKLLNVGAISWACGTMFEIVLASIVLPSLGWRWLLVLSAIPSFLIVILLKFLPESARYLVAAGRKDEAMKVLQKAAKMNRNSLPEGTVVNTHITERGNPRDLFSPMYLRTTLMVWILWFGTALSYYGMVLASAEILQLRNVEHSGEKCKCNLLKKDDYTSMIVSTLGEFIALPLNIFLIDLVGRRWTGAVNLFGCGLFFILLQLPVPQTVLTVFIFMVRGFSSGMFNFVYIYTSEVYPTTIRTLGIGTASSWARVGAMITPFLAQVLLDASLTAAVWVYGGIGITCAICAICLPIETKGRELPQTISLEDD